MRLYDGTLPYGRIYVQFGTKKVTGKDINGKEEYTLKDRKITSNKEGIRVYKKNGEEITDKFRNELDMIDSLYKESGRVNHIFLKKIFFKPYGL